MANVFRDANPATTFLSGVRRKMRIINLLVHRFIPMELKQRTDVISGTGKDLDGNFTNERL